MSAGSPLLIFIHIPRTGGTSLWKAMRAVYGRRLKRISGGGLARTRAEVADILRDRPDAYDVIGGHVPFGVAEGCARPCRYLTILRDPTDVVLSRYYKRRRPEVRERKRDLKGPRPLQGNPATMLEPADVLRKARRRPNPLTRILSGLSGQPGGRTAVVEPAHLGAARRNLATAFACFGFIERQAETLELMAAELGWGRVPEPVAANAGTNRPKAYEPAAYEVGREVHALDYELYDWAEGIFDERRATSLAAAGRGATDAA